MNTKITGPIVADSISVLTIAGIAIFTILYAIGDYAIPMSGAARHWWADLGWTIAALAAAIRCFVTAHGLKNDARMAWTLVGLGCFSWFMGMLVWSYFELIKGQSVPFPAISDIGFLALAPLMMAGLIIFLRRSALLALTIKTFSELALVLCVTLITLIIVLYKPIIQLQESTLYLVTALAYPVLYGGAFFFGIFRGFTSKDKKNVIVFVLLMAALFIHAVTDTLYAYSLLGKNYAIGSRLDILWILGFAAIYWAAFVDSIHQPSTNVAANHPVIERVKYLEATISGITMAWLVIIFLLFTDEITYEMMGYVLPFVFLSAILIVIISWVDRGIQEKLYADLMLSEKKLKAANLDLEERVKERTFELEYSRNQAIKASNAKSEFLSRMSHELRTPLNAVLGFSQLLNLDESLSKQQRESIVYIIDAGSHLLSLVNDALDLQGIEANKMAIIVEDVDLVSTIHDCLILVDHLAKKKGVSITNKIQGNKIYVKADQLKLKQIIINIISNAIKYNHINGNVFISCEFSENRTIRIFFNDTGIGIPEDQQEIIFDPFVRLNPGAVEGSGVGLAVTKKLALAMNGDIGVESTPANGTTFWVDLNLI